MPLYRIEIPGRGTFRVESPTELTDAQAYQAALESADTSAPDKSGFVPALKSGVAGLKGSVAATLGRTGAMDTDKAAQYMREQDAEGKRVFEPTQDGWLESPVKKTKELLGGSLPYMAAPLAVGAAAASLPVSGPAAAVAGVLGAGGASAAQFIGTNLSRQVDEGTPLAQTDLQSAALASVPQAALDVVSFRMTPMIRGILGAAGREVTDDVAKKIASQTLAKTLGDYALSTGKAVTAEGITEAAQQVLERLQAGLSITDPAAREEYWDNFIGGAVLGGTLAVPGRAMERSRERGQAAQAQNETRGRELAAQQAQEQQQAQVEAQRRTTPEFAEEADLKYQTLQRQVEALKEAAKAPTQPGDLAGIAAKVEARKSLRDLLADEETKKTVADWRATTPYREARKQAEAAQAAQQAQAAAAAAAAAQQQAQQQAQAEAERNAPAQAAPYFQSPQGTLPGMEAVEQPAVPAAQDDTAAQAAQFAEKQREMAQLLESHQQQESDAAAAGDIEALKRLRAKGVLLQNEHDYVSKQLTALGGAPVQGDVVSAIRKALDAEKAKLAQLSGPAYDPAKADKILAKIDELERQLKDAGYAGQPTQQGKLPIKASTAPFSEDKASFGARVYKPGAADIEAQEAAVLEESRRADDEAATEAERNRKVAPEAAALQRIGEKPAPGAVNEREAAAKLAEALPQGEEKQPDLFGSSVVGQDQQKLRLQPWAKKIVDARAAFEAMIARGQQGGKYTREEYIAARDAVRSAEQAYAAARANMLANEPIYTANEAPAAPPQPQRTAVKGEFGLHTAQGPAATPRTHEDIAQRLASALARQDLTPEAYALLRRAEQVLPQSDTANSESRTAADSRQRIRRDTASEEGLLTLLDKQLSLIERGTKEGLPAKGAERRVTYESLPVGETRVQKTKNEIKRTTLRGPSAAAPQLTYAKPLDAALRRLESVNRDDAGQKELFDGKSLQREASAVRKEIAQVEARVAKAQEIMRLNEERSMQIEHEDVQPLQQELAKLHKQLAGIEHQRAMQGPGVTDSPAAFRRLLNSPFVRKLRKQIEAASVNLRARWNRESPAIITRVDALKKRIAAMEKAQAEYKEAETVLKENSDVKATQRDLRELHSLMTKRVVTRMELAGQKDALQAALKQAETVAFDDLNDKSAFVADMKKKIDAAEAQLQDIANELGDIETTLKHADASIMVTLAQERLSALHEKAPFPIEIDKAREELREAQTELADLKEAATEEDLKLKSEDAERRRARQAVDKSEAEQARLETQQQRQRELEAQYRQDGEARTYDMISEAQRNARENPAQARAAVEADLHGANPQRVLGGYRSTVRRLQKKIASAIETSRGYMLKELEPLANRLDNLDRAYKNTRTAAQRDVIGPLLDKARAEYDKRASNVSSDTVTWVGMAQDRHDLELAEAKLEHLEDLIREGKVGETRPVLPAVSPAAKQRAELAMVRQQEENTEAAGRAEAPTTSGEALETSQARKRAAQTKTVYSSRGVGLDQLAADREAALKRAQEKQSTGKPLNPFDENALEQAKHREQLSVLAAGLSQGPKIGGANAAEALDKIAASTTDPLRKAIAERLAKLLGKTNIEYVHDLRDANGNAVHGLASVDGATIKIDTVDGGREDTLIHEGVHAATERLIRADEADLTPDQSAARKELYELYHKYVQDKNSPNENGKATLSEFVAEALSDAPLQQYLKSQKWALKNMWEGLKAGILKLLGIKTPENMLEATLAAADKLMTRTARSTAETGSGEFLAKPKYAGGYADLGEITDRVVAKDKTVYERVKGAGGGWLGLETQLVDRFAALEAASKYMDALKGTQMMYFQRMFDQRFHHVAQSVGNGAPVLNKITRADGRAEFIIESKPGASLRSVFEALQPAAKIVGSADGASRIFTTYMAAIRAQSKGIDKLNFGGAITQADLDKVMASVNADPQLKASFEAARAEYNQYNRNLLAFLVQSGAMAKDVSARLLKEDDYIPWYRARNGVAEMVIGGENPIKIGNLKEQPYLQELVGGDRPILDIATSSVQNTHMLVDMAMRNLATKSAAYELRDAGMAVIGRGNAAAGPDIVKFMDDGNEMFARVETDAKGIPADLLVKGMAGIPTQLTGVMRLLGAPAKFLRKAITSTPLYAARQLFRDSLAAPIMTGADFTPVIGALRQLGSANKGILESRGIVGGQVFNGTQEDLAGILRRIGSGKSGFVKTWAYFEGMSMEADALTRRAQYDSYRKQGLSEMEATLMALESMNFTKRGASPGMHAINAIVPFFNAQIQGLNVLYKALTGNLPFSEKLHIQEKLLTRGLMLMGASLAYAAAMQDDDAYKNATPEQRAGSWFVRIPGMDEPLKIPVPFEVGFIFKSLPEALYNTAAREHGGDEAIKALQYIALQVTPGGGSYDVPAAVKPLIELALNKTFYDRADLLTKREQGLEPTAQYRDNTTEVAKGLGKALDVSPIKIEHLVRGYMSTLGIAGLAVISTAIPAGSSPEKAARRWSEVPLVGGVFQANDAAGIINDTYERMEDFKKVKTTVDELLARGEKADATDLLQRKSLDYAKAEMANFFTSQMGELTKYERAVRASNQSPEEKRALLDKLRQAKINLATAVRAASDKTTRQ